MKKSDLRQKALSERLSLTQSELLNKSRLVSERILEIPEIQSAKTIMAYMSVKGEIVLDELIKKLFCKKIILVPHTEKDRIIPVRLLSTDDFVIGKFGVREPEELIEYTEKIDVCIIPGVAFSRTGKRIGFGGGYYDRFLAKRDVFKVGVSLSDTLFDDFVSEYHDINMDAVITENETIRKGTSNDF